MKEKIIDRIAVVGIVIALLISLVLYYFAGDLQATTSGVAKNYETTIFDKDKLMSVNIIMDTDQWEAMLSNAISEKYYSCDVEVNGTLYKNVGIRPKGNTSLSM